MISKIDKYTGGMPAAVDFCDITLANYNKWIFKIIKKHIGKKVLELGAGPGRFSKFLMKENLNSLLLLEPSPPFFEELLKITASQNYIEIVNSDIENFNEPSKLQFFDTIISIQALEHIENDETAILKASKYLQHGGKIIIHVPAMKWLFGHWDKQIGHYRRYEKKDVLRIAKATNLKICEIYYFNFIGIAAWWLNFRLKKHDFRKSSDSGKLNWQGLIFDKYLVPAVFQIENVIHPPMGIGLHFVLQKI